MLLKRIITFFDLLKDYDFDSIEHKTPELQNFYRDILLSAFKNYKAIEDELYTLVLDNVTLTQIDISAVFNMYKGTTFIKEGEDILEYSFIVPIAFISFYYKNRVLSCFLYKNGLILIIEYGYGKNEENSIDTENLIKILSEKLKVIFYNEQINNS